MTRHAPYLLAVLLLASVGMSQEDDTPRFVVHGIDGPLPATPLAKLADGWTAHLAGTKQTLAGLDWVGLRQEGRALPPLPALKLAQGTELSLFPPYVAAVLFGVPEGVDQPDLFLARLARESRPHDVLLLQNGDRIEGRVEAMDETGCALDADGRKVRTA